MAETIARLPLSSGEQALLDAADLFREVTVGFSDGIEWTGRIGSLLWQPLRRPRVTYAQARPSLEGRQRTVYLHRAVMCAKAGEQVDHINHNGLDNRKENLRIVTASQNCCNQRTAVSGKSTPYKGVAFYKKTGRFSASIGHNRKCLHIGYFATAEEAAMAYNHRALELFGEFALLNEVPA